MELDGAMTSRWTIVVPIKGFAQAKTRFADAKTRGDFARAFAQDLLDALSQCALVQRIVVVTESDEVRDVADIVAANTIPDPGGGLNAAIQAAASDHHPVAVFLGDLPCLRAEDITWALTQAYDHDRSFIVDAAGTGTTFLAATASELDPHFGPHSAAAHAASGAHRITGANAALHRDVDTGVDLWDAVRIGVGRATRAALAEQSG